jgi:hypothetical protein
VTPEVISLPKRSLEPKRKSGESLIGATMLDSGIRLFD